MEQVAHNLQTTAVARRTNPQDFDQFGRSAFNRYYYALYLGVRELLGQLDPAWERTAHANIAPLLNVSVQKALGKRRRRAQKVEDQQAVLLSNQALAAARELASTMLRGYSVRVTADYEPDVPITSGSQNRFSLGTTDITEAHEWPQKARLLSSVILRAWQLPE